MEDSIRKTKASSIRTWRIKQSFSNDIKGIGQMLQEKSNNV